MVDSVRARACTSSSLRHVAASDSVGTEGEMTGWRMLVTAAGDVSDGGNSDAGRKRRAVWRGQCGSR